MDHAFGTQLAAANHSNRFSNSIPFFSSSHYSAKTHHHPRQGATTPSTTRNPLSLTKRSDRDRLSLPNFDHTGVLQQHVCDSQTQWGPQTCLQPKKTQLISRCTSLQNGNYSGSNQIDQTSQLANVYRLIRCLSTYPRPLSIAKISTFSLESPDLSIHHHPVRPVSRALVVYKNHQADFGMGQGTEHSTECVPRRLDSDCGQPIRSSTTDESGSTKTSIIGLDHQLQKVNPHLYSNVRTPRLLIGYKHNDCTTAGQKDSRYSSQHQTSLEESYSISTDHSQFDDADISCNLRSGISSIV